MTAASFKICDINYLLFCVIYFNGEVKEIIIFLCELETVE